MCKALGVRRGENSAVAACVYYCTERLTCLKSSFQHTIFSMSPLAESPFIFHASPRYSRIRQVSARWFLRTSIFFFFFVYSMPGETLSQKASTIAKGLRSHEEF